MARWYAQLNVRLEPPIYTVFERLAEKHYKTKTEALTQAIRCLEKFHGEQEQQPRLRKGEPSRSNKIKPQPKTESEPSASDSSALEQIRELRDKNISYSKIANALNENGLQTPTGLPWTRQNVQRVYADYTQRKDK